MALIAKINESANKTTVDVAPGQIAIVMDFSRAVALKTDAATGKPKKLLDHGQTHGFQTVVANTGERLRLSAFVGQLPEDAPAKPKPPTK